MQGSKQATLVGAFVKKSEFFRKLVRAQTDGQSKQFANRIKAIELLP